MIAVRTVSFILALIAMLPASVVGAQSYPNDIALGQALFQDKSLSADRTVACASCHESSHGFSDPRSVPKGVYGRTGTRNAPSLLDLGVYQSFFWDGRAPSLAEQARVPFFSSVELGFTTDAQVLSRVCANSLYMEAFRRLDGATIKTLTLDEVVRAIQTYERSVGEGASPFDRYLAGDKAALSAQARHGLTLFEGKAECASCHMVKDGEPLTDNRFHTSAVGVIITPTLAKLAVSVARLSQTERYRQIESKPQISALGRYLVTLDPQDIGKFRTPSLRNVALTAPYMHDGSVATLAQAVNIEIYYRGFKSHTLIVSLEERRDILAFLESLSISSAAPQKLDEAGSAP